MLQEVIRQRLTFRTISIALVVSCVFGAVRSSGQLFKERLDSPTLLAVEGLEIDRIAPYESSI